MVWKQGASPVYDQSNNAGRQREIRRREVVSMSVRRIMGTETEYAVSALGMEHYNPVKLSFDVVGAAGTIGRRIRSTTPAAPGWNVHPRILIC